MAFKIPRLISTKKPCDTTGLTRFLWDDVIFEEVIGEGAFGKVIGAAFQGQRVVVKQCLDETDDRYFIKECRLISSLSHRNIVQCIGICMKPLSIMLEMAFFDFAPLGYDKKVHNLGQWLRSVDGLDDSSVADLADMFPVIGNDIASGLQYLHQNNVAHRDLKPANILVSNRQYSNIDPVTTEFVKVFQKCPILCKLTDFGESRSTLIQTQTLLNVATKNVHRGSIPYMAPEILFEELGTHDTDTTAFSLEQLKQIDIWAFGMTLYMLINPGVLYPYHLDTKPNERTSARFERFLVEQFRNRRRPSPSAKYDGLHRSKWRTLLEVYKECTRLDPGSRPPLSDSICRFFPAENSNQERCQQPTQVMSDDECYQNQNACSFSLPTLSPKPTKPKTGGERSETPVNDDVQRPHKRPAPVMLHSDTCKKRKGSETPVNVDVQPPDLSPVPGMLHSDTCNKTKGSETHISVDVQPPDLSPVQGMLHSDNCNTRKGSETPVNVDVQPPDLSPVPGMLHSDTCNKTKGSETHISVDVQPPDLSPVQGMLHSDNCNTRKGSKTPVNDNVKPPDLSPVRGMLHLSSHANTVHKPVVISRNIFRDFLCKEKEPEELSKQVQDKKLQTGYQQHTGNYQQFHQPVFNSPQASQQQQQQYQVGQQQQQQQQEWLQYVKYQNSPQGSQSQSQVQGAPSYQGSHCQQTVFQPQKGQSLPQTGFQQQPSGQGQVPQQTSFQQQQPLGLGHPAGVAQAGRGQQPVFTQTPTKSQVVKDMQPEESTRSQEMGEEIILDSPDSSTGLQSGKQTEEFQGFQRIENVTLGDFHQASSDVFQHVAAGTQCSSICLVSLIAAVYKNPDSWTRNDINSIVRAGDQLHIDTLRGKGWPYQRNEGKLDADELPGEVQIVFQGACLKASTCVTNNLICCLAKDVRGHLQHVFKNKDRALLLCRVGDKCRSIVFQNCMISLFDPHSCNAEGDVCPEGTAGVFHFDDLENLTAQLLKLLSSEGENQQVDLHICDIEILSEVFILEDSPDAEGTIAYEVDEYMASKRIESRVPHDQDNLENPYPYSYHLSVEEADYSGCTIDKQMYDERKTGLSLEDILSICVFQSHDENKICSKIPLPRSNSVYAIDVKKVNVKDLTCDNSGTYDAHSSPSVLVKAIVSEGKLAGTKIITRVKKNMTQDLQRDELNFIIKRKYSIKNDVGDGKQERIISLVYENGNLARYALVQYLGNWSIRLKPHKNSKSGNVYIRTKSSIMEKSRNLSENRSAKEVINLIDSENENLMNDATLGDLPQNRQQIYNIKKKIPTATKSRNTGPVKTADFQKLILSMDTQKFLRDIDFSFREMKGKITPNTFAATTNNLNMVKIYCSTSSSHKAQLAIDMTYKVGPFYTTCMSMAHPAFVHKNHLSRHPSIFVGMMTSTTRTLQDYTYLSSQLKKNGVKHLIYGTDGEVALEKGFEDVYPLEAGNVHLRCFNHVKDDLKAQLNQMKVENQEKIIDDILGHEYQSIRVHGLVDSETHDFERHYQTISEAWPQQFKQYFESKGMKIRSLKENTLKCMGREVRIAGGLGNPPNKYENQRAESINNVLKQAIGGFVDQAAVHDVVYTKVVLPQERECIKAISCQGEYRLSEDFKHFEVQPSRWLTMTPEQRQQHVKKLLSPSTLESDNHAVTKTLSVQPEECIEYIQNIPRSLINEIWEKAERVISHAKISDIDEHSTCIIYDKKVYVVRRHGCKFECTCDFFKKVSICSHVLVIADNTYSVFDFLKSRSYDPSKAVKRHISPSSGEKRVKKPRKGKQNIFKTPIETEITRSFSASGTEALNLNEQRPFQYTEIWHNDEPFVLEYAHSVVRPNEQLTCISCNCTISKKAMEPYDIILTHKERYSYPVNEDGRTVRKCTFKRLAKRFYCLKRGCVLTRHSYFWNGLIHHNQIELKDSHKKLLRDVFGFMC